jgi:adenosyl cobinamide kinase/adenosyl cobinamide phosphate guanylyltransferase
MNTRKTIYDKLFTEKVELAKHEVELSLFDDIKNAVKNYTVNNNKIIKANATVTKSVQSINSAMKDANIIVNKQMGKGVLAMAQKFQVQLDKTAKELGVNMAGSDVQKQIIELSNIAEQMQDNIDGVYELLKIAGK